MDSGHACNNFFQLVYFSLAKKDIYLFLAEKPQYVCKLGSFYEDF